MRCHLIDQAARFRRPLGDRLDHRERISDAVLKLGEQPGLRLLTLHNLHFVARLMEDLRDAVAEDRLAERAAALRAGEAPRGL